MCATDGTPFVLPRTQIAMVNPAAISIQRIARGFAVRKGYGGHPLLGRKIAAIIATAARKVAAVQQVQVWWRGCCLAMRVRQRARRAYFQRQHESTVRIQALWRGALARVVVGVSVAVWDHCILRSLSLSLSLSLSFSLTCTRSYTPPSILPGPAPHHSSERAHAPAPCT